eukprot:scaffold7724_cov27-Tisochrysis_lutea.AAC.3
MLSQLLAQRERTSNLFPVDGLVEVARPTLGLLRPLFPLQLRVGREHVELEGMAMLEHVDPESSCAAHCLRDQVVECGAVVHPEQSAGEGGHLFVPPPRILCCLVDRRGRRVRVHAQRSVEGARQRRAYLLAHLGQRRLKLLSRDEYTERVGVMTVGVVHGVEGKHVGELGAVFPIVGQHDGWHWLAVAHSLDNHAHRWLLGVRTLQEAAVLAHTFVAPEREPLEGLIHPLHREARLIHHHAEHPHWHRSSSGQRASAIACGIGSTADPGRSVTGGATAADSAARTVHSKGAVSSSSGVWATAGFAVRRAGPLVGMRVERVRGELPRNDASWRDLSVALAVGTL